MIINGGAAIRPSRQPEDVAPVVVADDIMDLLLLD
jgi:hypothetical protein